MTDETFQKAVPSQETKISWLHPSSVELVIHGLRLNAKAKHKVITRDEPIERYGLKESAPNEGRPNGGFLKTSRVDDTRLNENSVKGNKLDGYMLMGDLVTKTKENDARPSGEPLNLDDVKPNKDSPKDNKLTDDSPNSDFPTSEDEEDVYRVELDELKYIGRWALLLDKQQRNENKMTQQDRAWFKIDELCEQGLLSYATTSTLLYKDYPCTEELGCIWCFTADYRDEHDVRVRADVIRKALELELGEKEIFYVVNKMAWLLSRRFTLSEASLYRHTKDYMFCKKGPGDTWCHVRGTKEGAMKSTDAEFRKAIPSRVRVLPFIEPSVVEREKYIIRRKAKCTKVGFKLEKFFDQVMNNARNTNPEYSNPVESPPRGKEINDTKNIISKTSQSTCEDFIPRHCKPERTKIGKNDEYTKMKEPKLEIGREAFEYNQARHRDEFYEERKIPNGLKDVKLNSSGPIDSTECKDSNLNARCFEIQSTYIKPEGSLVCSIVHDNETDDRKADDRKADDTRTEDRKADDIRTDRKADDTRTNNSKQDQFPGQNDDIEDLLSLVKYLELEHSYLESVQDDGSYLLIWAMYFNKVTDRDLKSNSKDEERVKDKDDESKQKEDQGKGEKRISKGNEDEKKGKRKLKAKVVGDEEEEDDGGFNKQEDYEGMWILLFDKIERDTNTLTQLDRAWYKIDDLCENGFLQYATVSTAVVNRYPCSKSVGCIRCYTEDYRDEEDVRWRGDVIREALVEELGQTVIYYVKKRGNKKRYFGLKNASIYRHTPDYCFWKPADDADGGWELIPRTKGVKRARMRVADREIVPSRVTYDEYLYSPTPDCETRGDSGGPDPLKSISLEKYCSRKETRKPNCDSLMPDSDLSKSTGPLSEGKEYWPSCSSSDRKDVRPKCSSSQVKEVRPNSSTFYGKEVRPNCSSSEVKEARSILSSSEGREVRPSCSSSEGKEFKLNKTDNDSALEKTEKGNAELVDPSESEKELYGGKWMVFLDCVMADLNGHTLLDRAWFKIEDLCLEKRLVSAYVSTAKETIYDHNDNNGCICCCTEDYRNVGDVRRKGYQIRKTLEKEMRNLTIYYKTDAATFEGKFSVFGHKRICIYRQKPDCSLWEKLEGPPFWKLIF